MKKIYEKPRMQVEAFVANTYCVDCSDESHTMVTYKFMCTAGEVGHQYYIRNAAGNYQTIDGHRYGPAWESYIYHPCNAYHEITLPKGVNPSTVEDIITGLRIDDVDTWRNEDIEVVIWTENHTNLHATIELDPTEWQTIKS